MFDHAGAIGEIHIRLLRPNTFTIDHHGKSIDIPFFVEFEFYGNIDGGSRFSFDRFGDGNLAMRWLCREDGALWKSNHHGKQQNLQYMEGFSHRHSPVRVDFDESKYKILTNFKGIPAMKKGLKHAMNYTCLRPIFLFLIFQQKGFFFHI
jgi:hypothetical protein